MDQSLKISTKGIWDLGHTLWEHGIRNLNHLVTSNKSKGKGAWDELYGKYKLRNSPS